MKHEEKQENAKLWEALRKANQEIGLLRAEKAYQERQHLEFVRRQHGEAVQYTAKDKTKVFLAGVAIVGITAAVIVLVTYVLTR